MTKMDPVVWERLMNHVTGLEKADYVPGAILPPGGGREGDAPGGARYANLGPLAFVLNEAVDSAVNAGADRDALLETAAQAADTDLETLNGILSGEIKCPPPEIIQMLCQAVAIDPEIAYDAALKGGCRNFETISPVPPPGMP